MAKKQKQIAIGNDMELVDTNGDLPDDYALFKREIRQQNNRGQVVTMAKGFIVGRWMNNSSRLEYVGKTNCWHPLPGLASPMFENRDEAIEVARYLHGSRVASMAASPPVELEVKELIYSIAKKVSQVMSARQIHCTLSNEEARKLHAFYIACRQENVELPNGRPVASRADAMRYLLGLL